MHTDKLICDTTNITYNKGYIAMWLGDYPLPDTLEIDGAMLLKKDHFHVSLLCVKNILVGKPDSEAEVLQHFCNFLQQYDLQFAGFTNEFRVATDGERKSVVALCEVANLHSLADYLSEKIGINIAYQPAHVTLYTLQPNVGIGLNSPEELQAKSIPIEVPENIQAVL